MALGHGIEPWVTLVKDEPPLLDDVYLCFVLSLPLSTAFVDIVILISLPLIHIP